MSTSSHSYPMSSGDDQHSYIYNSSYQKACIDGNEEKTRRYILEKFDLLNLNSDLNTLNIADFGCSIGPNTFHAVQYIIDGVKSTHENRLVPLEFQVFFNDQPNNDFNTLFRTQPASSKGEYFSFGVPGSFHGRVLPRNSIHIGHTSYATHWLSEIPEHVCDKKSPAWNNYYIHCNNLIEDVTKAYKVQFTKDMRVFLEARAEEIVPEGLMIILGQCLPDGVPHSETWQGVVVDMIGDCLMDMAKLGVTTVEAIELFSIPVYFPQFSELEREIEQYRSFTLEMMEIISHPLEDIPLSNEFMTSMFRAIFYTIIKEHFGQGVVDELFDRLAKKLTKYPIDFKKCKKHVNYFMLLKRK
ncbi:PREDICTED: probable S-adenosylmethionine-dependent methyltransferase At5g38780 [Camelina sativa]|uniref:Probable S-adenosylmethionine-dependent methyltransferase At5g38780 n=1 Tax=Camelina sativa TaxID=90675 RepID=A0ABM0Y624_CAMSA|nr:PREDICTED: probable S-adenosylmethionine-dependent methyltransferase At5g38780 [Camelina sativa]